MAANGSMSQMTRGEGRGEGRTDRHSPPRCAFERVLNLFLLSKKMSAKFRL